MSERHPARHRERPAAPQRSAQRRGFRESAEMLGYRHAFHAGNHADVLKHVVLLQLVDYLAAKDKPFWYIDTHAGAGRYTLTQGYCRRAARVRRRRRRSSGTPACCPRRWRATSNWCAR